VQFTAGSEAAHPIMRTVKSLDQGPRSAMVKPGTTILTYCPVSSIWHHRSRIQSFCTKAVADEKAGREG